MAPRKTLNAAAMKKRLYRKVEKSYANMAPVPVVIDYRRRNRQSVVSRHGNSFHQSVGIEVVTKQRGWTLSTKELVEVFASIQSEDELLPFLEMCGPFRDRADDQELTWEEFVSWQTLIQSFRLSGALVFPNPAPLVDAGLMDAIIEPESFFRFKKDVKGRRHVWLEFHPLTALEAIGAAAYVDNLRGADLAACKLKDCPNVFERVSEHKREFCCAAHGRQWAKREERRRAKNAIPKEVANA